MLDDRAHRPVRPAPRGHGHERRVHVQQVIERQLLAVELLQFADARLLGGVQRRGLVRILPVAQLLAPLEREGNPLGPAWHGLREVAVDRGVVGGGVGKHLRGQRAA